MSVILFIGSIFHFYPSEHEPLSFVDGFTTLVKHLIKAQAILRLVRSERLIYSTKWKHFEEPIAYVHCCIPAQIEDRCEISQFRLEALASATHLHFTLMCINIQSVNGNPEDVKWKLGYEYEAWHLSCFVTELGQYSLSRASVKLSV